MYTCKWCELHYHLGLDCPNRKHLRKMQPKLIHAKVKVAQAQKILSDLEIEAWPNGKPQESRWLVTGRGVEDQKIELEVWAENETAARTRFVSLIDETVVVDEVEPVVDGPKLTYTQQVEKLGKELGVETSVAMDIAYLRMLEKRIIAAAKSHSEIRDFDVINLKLERQLDELD